MEYDFEKIIPVRSPVKSVYGCISDNEKTREWLPEIWIVNSDEQVDYKYLKENKIRFLFRINKKIKNELVEGMVESFYDDNYPKLYFQIKLKSDPAVPDWTSVQISVVSPIISSRKIEIITASGTILFLTALVTGFGNMSTAYAATVASSAIIPTPAISNVAAVSGTAIKGTVISKPLLAAIMVSIVAVTGGGVIVDDAYFSDPYVEYSLYPHQLPAELHGTELTITGFYSDDGSLASSYECDSEPIIYGLDYSFDCIAKNSLGIEQTVTTAVQFREPVNHLNAKAMDCVSRHDSLSDDDVTVEFPYLLNLPELSPSRIVNLKNEHIKLMDDAFEVRDYTSAKKHAMIMLKYFNENDIQTLSTLGNAIRDDEDRQNKENVDCAVAIHSTPYMANTSWGTLSLAEDNHVLGNFATASSLASQVIDAYHPDGIYIEEITYKNALIIKANALFRMAMDATDPNVEDIRYHYADAIDEIRYHYTEAHKIEKSYDTWFGLGNLDRYVGDFDDALEKYKEAKKMARDTTEIDYEIDVLSSYH